MRYVRKTRVDQYAPIIQKSKSDYAVTYVCIQLGWVRESMRKPQEEPKYWDINAENDKNDEEPWNWDEYPSAGSFSHLAQHINPKTYRYVTQKYFLYVSRKRPVFKQDSTHRFRSRPLYSNVYVDPLHGDGFHRPKEEYRAIVVDEHPKGKRAMDNLEIFMSQGVSCTRSSFKF